MDKNRSRERERELSKRIIIWALYDDAESSCKKAIKKHFLKQNLEVHSIGINDLVFRETSKFFYHKIDLSLNNFNLINQLTKQLPHPDIILASPPCESWSGADCDGRMLTKVTPNGQWFVKNAEYYNNYNKKCHPVKKRYFVNKERTRLIGESTIGGTIAIIQHFDPKVWVIENPKTSKTWEFQKNHWNFPGHMNDTYYASYDSSFSLKPTIFKSNIKLKLKKTKPKSVNKDHMALASYSRRSAIPDLLIKDLVNQILNSNEITNTFKTNLGK